MRQFFHILIQVQPTLFKSFIWKHFVNMANPMKIFFQFFIVFISITIYYPVLLYPLFLAITTPSSMSMYPFSFLLHPSTLYPPPPLLLSCSLYMSLSIFLVSSVCSSDSTYEWNYVVFVFLRLAFSLNIMFSSSIHTVAKGKTFFFFIAQ